MAFRPSGRCLVRCWAAQPKRAAEGSRRQQPPAPEGRRQAWRGCSRVLGRGLGSTRLGAAPEGWSPWLTARLGKPLAPARCRCRCRYRRKASGQVVAVRAASERGRGAARASALVCAALPPLSLPSVQTGGGIPSARAVLSSAPPRFATPRNGHQTMLLADPLVSCWDGFLGFKAVSDAALAALNSTDTISPGIISSHTSNTINRREVMGWVTMPTQLSCKTGGQVSF